MSTLLLSNDSTPESTPRPDPLVSVTTRQNLAPPDPSSSKAEIGLIGRLWLKRNTAVRNTVAALTLLCAILGLWVAFSAVDKAKEANLFSEWNNKLTFYEFCKAVGATFHLTCRASNELPDRELTQRRKIGVVQAARRPGTILLDRRPSWVMLQALRSQRELMSSRNTMSFN